MRFIVQRFILGCVLLTMTHSLAQSKLWESMYSYYNTSAAVVFDQNMVVAAENTLFIYDVEQNLTETITTIEGLPGDNISALAAYHPYLLIGHQNGVLTQMHTQTKEIILDNSIERNTSLIANQKHINHIQVSGDLAYLATGYGITVLNPTTLEFGDTYYFGSLGNRKEVFQAMIHQNNLYAATEQGLYKTSLDNPQILQFSSWELLANGKWVRLWEQDDQLYGAQDLSNEVQFFLVGDSIEQKARFTGKYKYLEPYDNGLILTLSSVYHLNKLFTPTKTITSIEGVPSNTFQFAMAHDNSIWIGTKNHGFIRYISENNSQKISPSGPLLNTIFDIQTLPNELWVSHGDYDLFYNPYPLDKFGISHFSEQDWINIPHDSLFDAVSIVRIVPHPSQLGTLYACSFHSGIVPIEENTPKALWDQTNSGLESLSFVGPNYVSIRVRDAVIDRQDNLWSLTSFVQNGLKKRSSSGQWTSYDLSEAILDYSKESGYSNMELFEDKILFFGGINSGLIGVDISQSPPKMKRLLGGEGGLPSDDVRSIRLDNDNRLWVGTRDGMAVLYSPNRFFEDDIQLRPIIVSDGGNLRELLSGQLITDIEVDGNNQKWIGTVSSGVFLISPDGTQILQHFTKENSPLPTSSIKTIGVDRSTGKVYLGTLSGMVVYQGDAYAESETLSEANVFPNPVRPNYTGNLVVRGLQQDARIKITDIAGNLVYDTTSQGGSISWNLRSFSGQRVRSGVYLIFISSKDGLDSAVKKVMIIN